MRMDSSSGKSRARRRAICSGLHARAHRRCCRRPCRRPVHGTTGLRSGAPLGATTTPANRSCTYPRSVALTASFAGFGRQAARSACHCAVVARYSKPPARVAALRRNSREIVDGARASRRAISRTPCPWARQSAICSRSVNARYRPDGSGADDTKCDGAMPPASRNHRTPTAGDTPAPTAASSLERPAAIAAQNRRRSSRRPTEGRPGDRNLARPARSERRLRVIIATPSAEVLRRPLESAQYTSITFGLRCREAGVRPSMGHVGDAYDNALCESFFATLECELLDRRRFKTQAEARMAVFEFIEGFYNPRRRHSSLGYLSPVDYERRHEQGALDPGAHHPAAVLGTVKVRPGDVAIGGKVGATADLDRPCARPLHKRAGRDEKMLSAEPKDGPRKQQKEDTLPPNPLP